jgi:hypothetical protein
LRLAGGDNAIGMIRGDLVGSEQFRGVDDVHAGGVWPVVHLMAWSSGRPGR